MGCLPLFGKLEKNNSHYCVNPSQPLNSVFLVQQTSTHHQLYEPLAPPPCARMPMIHCLSTNPRFPPFNLLSRKFRHLLLREDTARKLKQYIIFRVKATWTQRRSTIEVHPNFAEVPHLRSSIPPPPEKLKLYPD